MNRLSRLLLGLAAAAVLPSCGQSGSSGNPFAVRISQSPSLALSAADPFVAWQDNASGGQQIYFKSWTGAAFAETAGSASGAGLSGSFFAAWFPSLAVDGAGQAVAAWSDFGQGVPEIHVRRLEAGVWEELDGSATAGGISGTGPVGHSYSPRVATGGTMTPVVAWQVFSEEDGAWRLYVRQWDGAAWTELAGSGSDAPLAASFFGLAPAAAIDPATGYPVVAWQDLSTDFVEIYLLAWDGAAWVELGGSASGGGVSATAGFAVAPAVVLEPGGNPVVAWQDFSSGASQVYVKRWDGAAWVELAGSASGGGISASTKFAEMPALAVDSSGFPVVAWREAAPVFAQIYLKRWDGAAWVELGGSATGGGVSGAPVGNCARPSLAVDPSDFPVVAWMYATAARANIYLKRWNGAAWVEQGGSATGTGLSN